MKRKLYSCPKPNTQDPHSHRLTNPTYRSMGDAISMSKNPIPKKRKIYFCCDYFYNVNFHRSVLVENLNSEISLALADHFRRPQKFSCRFENNYLPLRTPAHSFSFHNDRTDRGMKKTSQELRMLSPSLFIQGSQCNC